MSKLNFVVYPAVAVLALAAAFAAHAQSANDPVDQAGYGAMPAAAASTTAAATTPAAASALAKYAAPAAKSVTQAAASKRNVRDFDPVDHAGYGPMVADTSSVRTRAEVRAEAIAAVRAGGR